MKIIVLGSAGMLGRYVTKYLSPKFNVIGGAGNACCGGGAVICGSCGGAVICGSCGINPCDVACANVKTGVEVVVSRHKENLPGCALI